MENKTDIDEFPGKKITFSTGKLLLEIPICCKRLGENQERKCVAKNEFRKLAKISVEGKMRKNLHKN